MKSSTVNFILAAINITIGVWAAESIGTESGLLNIIIGFFCFTVAVGMNKAGK